MKKRLLVLLSTTWLLIVGVVLVPGFAAAKQDPAEPIPEVDGTYDEPGHPDVKVRVIVHKAKFAKPDRPGGGTSTLVCNLQDPDSTAVVPAAGWKLASSWTYNLNPSSVPSTVGGGNLSAIASNGFGDWAAATGGKVSFTRGSDTSINRQAYDGQNVVAWGRTSGSALAVTYIRYNISTKVAVDVDTIVNKLFTWRWSSQPNCAYSNAYDAENILTHELGHWTGLDDTYSSSYQDNTMYGNGSVLEVKKNTLTTGDNLGAYQIYNP